MFRSDVQNIITSRPQRLGETHDADLAQSSDAVADRRGAVARRLSVVAAVGGGVRHRLRALLPDGITDYFDGYLARAQGAVSKLGVFLDPIADKIMVAAVILMLVGTRHDDSALITGVHLIAALIILLREIAVSGLREFLAGLQVSLPVSKLAKWKTTLQLVAFGALILAGALPAQVWIKVAGLGCLWGAAALTLVTGWDYLRVGLKHMD